MLVLSNSGRNHEFTKNGLYPEPTTLPQHLNKDFVLLIRLFLKVKKLRKKIFYLLLPIRLGMEKDIGKVLHIPLLF